MAKVNIAKSGKSIGKRFLTIPQGELTGETADAVAYVFELREQTKAAELEAIALLDKAFPQLAKHPVTFKWDAVNVALDDQRNGQMDTPKAASPKQSLSDFIASQLNGGRHG